MNDDAVQLNDELSRLYARLSEVTHQLSDEQAVSRNLRGVIALLPYNAVRRPRLVPLNRRRRR